MAHVGQKLGFGPRRRQRLLVGRRQRDVDLVELHRRRRELVDLVAQQPVLEMHQPVHRDQPEKLARRRRQHHVVVKRTAGPRLHRRQHGGDRLVGVHAEKLFFPQLAHRALRIHRETDARAAAQHAVHLAAHQQPDDAPSLQHRRAIHAQPVQRTLRRLDRAGCPQRTLVRHQPAQHARRLSRRGNLRRGIGTRHTSSMSAGAGKPARGRSRPRRLNRRNGHATTA